MAAGMHASGRDALARPAVWTSRRVLEKCGFVRDGTATPQVEFPNLSPGVLQEALCYAVAIEHPRTQEERRGYALR